MKDLNSHVSIIVVNDASSEQIIDNYPNTENIKSIEIINMKENRGHARCNAFGIRYVFEKIDFDKIEKIIKSQLARYKHPKKFIIIDELPRNTMGKVQKNLLRDQYRDTFL